MLHCVRCRLDASAAGFAGTLTTNAGNRGATIEIAAEVKVPPFKAMSTPTVVTCPDDCNSNGQCRLDGSCLCNDGFAGTSCAEPVCLNNCTHNGACLITETWPRTTYCQCEEFWLGDDCSQPTRGLPEIYVWGYSPSNTKSYQCLNLKKQKIK